jgi:branched-chain amino acid transport system permease protein
MEDALRILLTGVSYGMILFLIASGLSLTLGFMGILNLAHGSLYMLGAYIGLMVTGATGSFLAGLGAATLSVGFIGLLMERGFLSRLYKQFNDQVLLTLGFVYIFSALAYWVWGAYPLLGQVPELLKVSIPMGRLSFPVYRLVLIGIGVAVFVASWWLQERTRAGSIVRAGMDDREMTMGLGVNFALISSGVFFLGAAMAGFAGFLGSPITGASWDMGFPILIQALIVVVIGGVGRVQGTFVGALVIGLIDSLGKTFFPEYAAFTVYVFFIVVLLFRPTGLLGRLEIGGRSAPPPPTAVHDRRRTEPRSARWDGLIKWVPLAVVGGIMLIAPPFLPTYLRTMLTQILIFGLFAMSLNLLFGYTGLFSLGHAAFFGVGAYAAGIMAAKLGTTNFWLVMAVGMVAATAVAALFGLIALRVRAVYFLFVTLALGELLAAVALKATGLTGGSNGLFGIGYPDLLLPITLTSTTFYYLVLLVTAACIYILYRIIRSPFGLALQGIRDDELRMSHLGYNPWVFKYIAFLIAGLFAGVAGVLFAWFGGTVVPSFLAAAMSALVMLMVIIGSSTLFWGPLLGAAVILFLQYYVSIWIPQWWTLVLGVVFVLTVLLLPGGLGVHLQRAWARLRFAPPATADQTADQPVELEGVSR